MNGYFYYEGGILKHHRTPGSKNGESHTVGYTAQGTPAQMTSDGHYASQYGKTQSQILAQNPYYTGDKVLEQDRIMEDERQKKLSEIQSNPAAYAAQQQAEQQREHDRREGLKRHAKKLRDSIDRSDDEVRYRRGQRSTAGNVMVDLLSDIYGGVKKTGSNIKNKVGSKIKNKVGSRSNILKSYIRELRNKKKK